MAKNEKNPDEKKVEKKVETLSDAKAELETLETKMLKHYNSDDVDKQNALIAKIKAMSEKKKEA